MKVVAFEANGYNFEVDIDPDTPLGIQALMFPLNDLIQVFKNAAVSLNVNPSNIEELNEGGRQIVYRIVS